MAELVEPSAGICTHEWLSNRMGIPGVPVARVKGRTLTPTSERTTSENSMGVPQTNSGAVLILNGVRLVAEAPGGISG